MLALLMPSSNHLAVVVIEAFSSSRSPDVIRAHRRLGLGRSAFSVGLDHPRTLGAHPNRCDGDELRSNGVRVCCRDADAHPLAGGLEGPRWPRRSQSRATAASVANG